MTGSRRESCDLVKDLDQDRSLLFGHWQTARFKTCDRFIGNVEPQAVRPGNDLVSRPFSLATHLGQFSSTDF